MSFDFSPVWQNRDFLLGGLWVTVALSALSVACSLVLGCLVGLARCYGPRWLKAPLVFYIDTMRAVPVLVVMVWTYFVGPILIGRSLGPFASALVALTIHIAAYVAETVRAGIESVRPGQLRAGVALGMSRGQVIRTIVLPQAIVRMLPAIGSIISITIKDTAIATVIAVPELMERSATVAGQTYRPIEIFTIAMLVYFVILFPLTRAIDIFYQRVAFLGRS